MKKTTKKLKNTQKKDLPSVYIALLSLVVIVVVFFLAYLSKMSKVPQTANGPAGTEAVMNGQQVATLTILPAGGSLTQQQNIQSHMTLAENSGSVPANSRVKFKIDHFKKLALQPLEFDVFDENGKAYAPADLQGTTEKIHLVIVSADLREFQHLLPAYQNGKWKILANLPNPGTYYAYVDIEPVKGSPVVLRSNLVVQKETTETLSYPGLTPDLLAIVKGYTVRMSLSQALVLQQTVLSYKVIKDGKPAELKPAFGGLGHLVIFRQGNIDSYTGVPQLSSSDAKKGLAEFMTTFVKGGRYTAFAEFKLGNVLYTFPITFDING